MKKTTNLILIAITLLMTGILAGCSSSVSAQTKEIGAMAIIAGPHACSMGLNLNNKYITNPVYYEYLNYGYIAIINCDGRPVMVKEVDCDIPDQYKKAAKNKLEADARAKTIELMRQLTQIKAKEPEVDTLEALRLATRALSVAHPNSEKVILVCDTGLSTTGILDFSNNLLSVEPEIVIDMLEEKQAIPDFTNTTIKWMQMGDCAAPQKSLTPKQADALEAIWRGVIERGGGTFEKLNAVPLEAPNNSYLPTVTPIDFPDEEPIKFDVAQVEDKEDPFVEPVFFSEEQVQFKGDSDIYIDEAKALSSIEPVADYMVSEPDFSLLLVGTTAGDTDSDYVRNLSFARASAVRNSLVNMGVPKERITVIGAGNQDPWHIKGVGTSGEMAAQNRKVVLISMDTEIAGNLIQVHSSYR